MDGLPPVDAVRSTRLVMITRYMDREYGLNTNHEDFSRGCGNPHGITVSTTNTTSYNISRLKSRTLNLFGNELQFFVAPTL